MFKQAEGGDLVKKNVNSNILNTIQPLSLNGAIFSL